MLCEKCNKNPATFHYTEVVNGVKSEHHLCSECAANTDASYYSSIFDGGMHFGQLLSGLLGGKLFADGAEEDPACSVQCPNCGLTYGEFVKNSAFGCPDCYDVFGPLISEKIKKIQGSDRHVGKKPMIYGENTGNVEVSNADGTSNAKADITVLDKKLQEAIACEDFAEAARLRDLIHGLKEETHNE